MMNRAALAMALVVLATTVAPVTFGQEAPPELGPIVLEETLIGSGPLRTSSSQHSAQFAGEGFVLRVVGRPSGGATGVVSAVERLTLPDGELRVEARFSGPLEGLLFQLQLRVQANEMSRYNLNIQPAQGLVALRKAVAGGPATTIAQRTGLAHLAEPEAWHTFAVRAAGPTFWVLVDDEPLFSGVDSALDVGGLGVAAFRLDGPSDDADRVVTLRNLRVSGLEGSELARAPVINTAPVAPPAAGPILAASSPPELGAVVAEDPLTGPGMLPTGFCPTGRASGQFVGEGTMFRVSGKCRGSDSLAVGQTRIPGLMMADGEIRVEMKVAGGSERAGMVIYARSGSTVSDAYNIVLLPALGIGRIATNVGGPSTTIAQRTDLGSLIRTDDWTAIALRLEGPNLWLLVNDLPVLTATDATYDAGGVWIRVARTGDVNDGEEVAVVLRNLRVSALASGDPNRSPTYQKP